MIIAMVLLGAGAACVALAVRNEEAFLRLWRDLAARRPVVDREQAARARRAVR